MENLLSDLYVASRNIQSLQEIVMKLLLGNNLFLKIEFQLSILRCSHNKNLIFYIFSFCTREITILGAKYFLSKL